MEPARQRIEQLLRVGGGVIVAREHPDLARTIRRLAQADELRALFPGVFCHWSDFVDPDVRIQAVGLWRPDAVVTGRAAARWTFWPELSVPRVTLSLPDRVSRTGFAITCETLPIELITTVRGVRMTVPALTGLDLAGNGAGIDRALLARAATLDDFAYALELTPRRRGNEHRRALLRNSRAEPWSALERELHSVLRAARITGWRGNVPVACGSETYVLDAVFDDLKIALEMDGYKYHRQENRAQFHRDRRKWTSLTADGWIVLHFTWEHVTEDPEWVVAMVRQAVAMAKNLHAS